MANPTTTPDPLPRSTPQAERDHLLLLVVGLSAVLLIAAVGHGRRSHLGIDRIDHWPAYRINVNAADAVTLELLPGFGSALADKLIADRQSRGPFTSLDDLQRISGVGPIIARRVGDHVCFGPPAGGGP